MSKDPFYSAGPPGSWGRPDIKHSGPTFARNDWWANRGELRATNEDDEGGLYDRASAALSFGSNGRFARLVQKFMSYMRRAARTAYLFNDLVGAGEQRWLRGARSPLQFSSFFCQFGSSRGFRGGKLCSRPPCPNAEGVFARRELAIGCHVVLIERRPLAASFNTAHA